MLKDGQHQAKVLEDTNAAERAVNGAIPIIKECLDISPNDQKCASLLAQASSRDPTLKGKDGKKMTDDEIADMTAARLRAACAEEKDPKACVVALVAKEAREREERKLKAASTVSDVDWEGEGAGPASLPPRGEAKENKETPAVDDPLPSRGKQYQQLLEQFQAADTDSSGGISKSEQDGVFKGYGPEDDKPKLKKIWKEIDRDHNGVVTMEEYMIAAGFGDKVRPADSLSTDELDEL
jgi:hypothetical protein